MGRKRLSVLAALTAFLTMICGLFVPYAANASSVYDAIVDPASEALIGGGPCGVEDITSDWSARVFDSTTPYGGGSAKRDTVLEAVREAIRGNKDVSLVQQTSYDTNLLNFVSIVLTTKSTNATFTTYSDYLGDHPYLRIGNSVGVHIYKDGYDSCATKLYFSTSGVEHVLTQEHDLSRCYGGFCDKRQLVYTTSPIAYPSGYAGVIIPDESPGQSYVAMGDSFSSGEGNSPFETGTGSSGVNECHRNSQAYPRLLQADTSLDLGLTAFVACSGATTSDVLYGGSDAGNWDEGPQVDALSEETDIVTITIGGNDVGFQEYLPSCVGFCGPNTLTYEAIIDNIESPAFQDNLETTYEEILDRAENAMVYVVDYPYMTAEDAETCGVLDFSGGRGVQIALNSTIETAVSNVRAQSEDYLDRLRYVDVNTLGSPFEGGHLCNGGESDFGSLTFHPNTQGHIDYASILASEIG